MAEDVTLADYTAYLQRMQPVIVFADDVLLPFLGSTIPLADERKKAHLIQSDLQALHVTPSSTPGFHPFTPTSTAYALGFFYVIEGSVLGGRVLLKHLQQRLPITEDEGGHFFAGYKDRTSEKWKGFLLTFADFITERRAEEEAITGATDAFTSIRHHFNT